MTSRRNDDRGALERTRRVMIPVALLATVAAAIAACGSESEPGPGSVGADAGDAAANDAAVGPNDGAAPPHSDAGSEDAARTDEDANADASDASTSEADADAGADGDGGPTLLGVLAIAPGQHHTCALLYGGSVKCWGATDSGALGLGSNTTRGDGPGEMGAALAAVDLGAGRTAIAVSVGNDHSCAVLDNGSVKCWGYNEWGQLGQGDTSDRGDEPNEMGDNLPPVDLGPGRSASAITSGRHHTCALLDDATVKCWGLNNQAQLGQGNAPSNRGDAAGEMGASLAAVDLGPGRTALAISAGYDHTCARLDNGSVKCWGFNQFGQLGLGDGNTRGVSTSQMGANLPAVDLGPGRTATAISAGGNHTCALLDSGAVKCWGTGGWGELGQGDTAMRGDGPNEMGANLPAIDLGPGRTALKVSAGGDHSCALLDDSTVKCWGGSSFGQLGLGDKAARGDGANEMGADLPAVDLGPGRTVVDIRAGSFHTCARFDDRSLKCWGSNTNGQLGLGDLAARGDGANEMGIDLPSVAVQ